MISVSRLNVLLFAVMFFVFVFAAKFFLWAGVRITGIEYILWFFCAAFLVLLNFLLLRQRFVFRGHYVLLFSILSVMCVFNFLVVDVPVVRYLQGTFFTFLFALNFLLFYNIKVELKDFLEITDLLIFIITGIALFVYLERIFVPGSYQSFFLRGTTTLAKDPAFAASLFNINIILSFVMYMFTRRRKYLYIVGFSILTIALLLFLKSVLAALFISFMFIRIFMRSFITKYFFYGLAAAFFLALPFFGKPLMEDIQYKYQMYFGEGSEKIPRNALYFASFKIARDYFPFGSGQGTFGSYPVGKEYSTIYYDYDLDEVQGLGPRDVAGLTDSHFIFDTHWSSIIGELGFIGAFLFLILWFYPALKSYRYMRSDEIEIKALAFFITMTTLSVFIESIASPVPNQLQFILIYAGLGGIALRLLVTRVRAAKAEHDIR